jgi:hypothetical protein
MFIVIVNFLFASFVVFYYSSYENPVKYNYFVLRLNFVFIFYFSKFTPLLIFYLYLDTVYLFYGKNSSFMILMLLLSFNVTLLSNKIILFIISKN